MRFIKISLVAMALSTTMLGAIVANALYGPTRPMIGNWTTTVAKESPESAWATRWASLPPDKAP